MIEESLKQLTLVFIAMSLLSSNVFADSEEKELVAALGKHKKSMGMMPGEYIQLTPKKREAYVRGVLDGEIFLYTQAKLPDADKIIFCLNRNFALLMSQIVNLNEDKLQGQHLMPWAISKQVGKMCLKYKSKSDSEYKRRTTFLDLEKLRRDDKGLPWDIDNEKGTGVINSLFIRGVIDGKIFVLYGFSWPKLPAYLNCVSSPDIIRKIYLGFKAGNVLANDLENQVLSVAKAEGVACQGL
jgi:hypothetical protein